MTEFWRGANYHLKDEATRIYRCARLRGRVERPNKCEDCGRGPEDGSSRLSGHHEDYAKPLDVVWLCGLCHASRHRNRDLHFQIVAERKEAA